ncbi:hypothetical protein HAX54_040056, partial [Datura stramonium]|nr:hypothetical protein [Datura stramonium]
GAYKGVMKRDGEIFDVEDSLKVGIGSYQATGTTAELSQPPELSTVKNPIEAHLDLIFRAKKRLLKGVSYEQLTGAVTGHGLGTPESGEQSREMLSHRSRDLGRPKLTRQVNTTSRGDSCGEAEKLLVPQRSR